MPAATKVTIEIYTYLEYAILELKLAFIIVALYRAFLCCSFAAAMALHLRSLFT